MAVAAVAVWAAPASSADPGGPITRGASGVCAGVTHCTVVAHVDVNGEGTRDAVGLARRGKDGAARGFAQVRVLTEDGAISKIGRFTHYWYGHLWQGAAHIDGHRGHDLIVGHEMGAHAEVFVSYTWRDGSLARLDAPGKGGKWLVDEAYADSYGWQHKTSDPRGLVRKRKAIRIGDSNRFRGSVRTFRWSDGGWAKRSTVHRRISQDRAGDWGGFHVPGLQRY
jgi:hypothetical protein